MDLESLKKQLFDLGQVAYEVLMSKNGLPEYTHIHYRDIPFLSTCHNKILAVNKKYQDAYKAYTAIRDKIVEEYASHNYRVLDLIVKLYPKGTKDLGMHLIGPDSEVDNVRKYIFEEVKKEAEKNKLPVKLSLSVAKSGGAAGKVKIRLV